MIAYLGEFLVRFSVISLGLCFLRSLRKRFCMASLIARSSSTASSSSSSNVSILEQFGGINLIKRQKISSNFKADIIFQEKASPESSESNIVSSDHQNRGSGRGDAGKPSILMRKRPAQLVVPAFCPEVVDFGEKRVERKELEVEGKGFALASKKGKRQMMEDGHGVMLDISGNPKQAFFVVIDGHGGRAAADFVAENLGSNIIREIRLQNENEIEAAVRRGYSITDDQFLRQKVQGGACAASVLVKDGELHVANVGDCKVILCRNGVAHALTVDHRLTREDERARIHNSGGFLDCRHGVWRVNGTLAVSRAFGDIHLKDHVISEPETLQLPLTSDCDFLIMASDGLWDKVGEQEAVDVVVARRKDSLESCKELVAMSSSRGCVDDVTVMLINLQNFVN